MQPPGSMWNGVYGFDAVDGELALLPMAARRALDIAGLHVSLEAWQRAPLAVRRALVALGAATRVHAPEVAALLHAANIVARELPALLDPAAAAPPPELCAALAPERRLEPVQWAELRALDRYVLAQLARRGKLARLVDAYDEIMADRQRD